MRTFVDTNIVLYAYDQSEPEKSAIAREIRISRAIADFSGSLWSYA